MCRTLTQALRLRLKSERASRVSLAWLLTKQYIFDCLFWNQQFVISTTFYKNVVIVDFQQFSFDCLAVHENNSGLYCLQ